MIAATRLSNTGRQNLIWPGFVDGLATLLMVVIFVLMIFFLIQINLAHRLFGQDTEMHQLQLEISELTNLLNLERRKAGALALERQQLGASLRESENQAATLQERLALLESAIAVLESEKAGLTEDISQTQEALTKALGEREAVEAEAASLQDRLAALEERISTIIAERDTTRSELTASRAEILQMTTAMLALRSKMLELQALLDDKTREAREAKEVSANLAKQLNDALSSKVAELTRFRSDFFGRLREVLQDRHDIAIVGDRFVFQSEVLFSPGSAEINAEGKIQLNQLNLALTEIAATIPDDIDWVLQIDGHTDNVPIRNDAYRDNWELSTARAVSVVRYLIEQGMNPGRLAATGYGEFQPVDRTDSTEARARNRRIEFKLTRKVARSQSQ